MNPFILLPEHQQIEMEAYAEKLVAKAANVRL